MVRLRSRVRVSHVAPRRPNPHKGLGLHHFWTYLPIMTLRCRTLRELPGIYVQNPCSDVLRTFRFVTTGPQQAYRLAISIVPQAGDLNSLHAPLIRDQTDPIYSLSLGAFAHAFPTPRLATLKVLTKVSSSNGIFKCSESLLLMFNIL